MEKIYTFPKDAVIDLYKTLESLGIKIWVDGGWGVDILLGKQTRAHDDIDIVLEKKYLPHFLQYTTNSGYRDHPRDDASDWNFVLENPKGFLIDVHVIVFDENGKGIYGPKERGIFYPASAFTGIGAFNSTSLRCISAEYQIQSHSGYTLREKDYRDVILLCSKYNLILPHEYKNYRVMTLTHLVRDFYESHRDTWIPNWTEYLYEHHIFFVSNLAKELSVELGINPDFPMAASMLHDIADAVLDRKDSSHMKHSEDIALNLLSQSGFTQNESDIIVSDIIRKHSCSNGNCPSSIEGKIMTSANAICHITTDFFEFAIKQMKQKGSSLGQIKTWGLRKVEKDFFVKIPFESIRERYREDYERCKILLETI